MRELAVELHLLELELGDLGDDLSRRLVDSAVPAEVAGVVVGGHALHGLELEVLLGEELGYVKDLKGHVDVPGVLLLEHPVASRAGEHQRLDSKGLDGVDVLLHDLGDVLLRPSDPLHDRTAADLVDGGEIHAQLLQDGQRRGGGLLAPVGGGASGEVSDLRLLGRDAEGVHDGLLLAVGVVVLQDAVDHLLVLGQDVAVGDQVRAAELDDVDDLDLGGAAPLAVRTGGACVHVLDDRVIGGDLPVEETVGQDDASPGQGGIPPDRLERRTYALAETAHGADVDCVPYFFETACGECHFTQPWVLLRFRRRGSVSSRRGPLKVPSSRRPPPRGTA